VDSSCLSNEEKSKKVRASIGTLAKLNLFHIKMDAEPETAYILTEEGCLGKCKFCPQWLDQGRLSRLVWPEVEINTMVRGQRAFKRICVQSTLKRMFWKDVIEIASQFDVPVSISINPVNTKILREIRKVSDRLGIGLDAMSPRIFEQVSKPGTWRSYMRFIEKGVRIYEGKVHVHLIAGLGETLMEAYRLMREIYSAKAEVALFSFTPVRGTPMEKKSSPEIHYYRALQVIRFSLAQDIPLKEILRMDPDDYREAFLTSGCPHCNRPFYNERPRGPIYNFPNREFLDKMWELTRKEVLRSLEYLRVLS